MTKKRIDSFSRCFCGTLAATWMAWKLLADQVSVADLPVLLQQALSVAYAAHEVMYRMLGADLVDSLEELVLEAAGS